MHQVKSKWISKEENMKGGQLRDTWAEKKYYLASILHFANTPRDKLLLILKIINKTTQTKNLVIQPNSLPKTSLSPVWFNAILDNCNKLTTSFTIMPSCGLPRSSLKKKNL